LIENIGVEKMPNVYIESYGCSNSQAEAEIMAGLLEKAGFDVVSNENNADVLIVVTCYVKSPTQQKILFRIRQLNQRYSDKKIIIAGCMPEGIHGKLMDVSPESSMVSTHHVKDIVKAVEKTTKGKRVEYLGESKQVKLCLPKIRKNSLIDIVPISSGCNSSCSYCCVRLAKGKLFSYPKEMIVKEVRDSVRQGCKDIWITSQDNASYGDGRLPELMNELSRISGSFFVRIGMMNPKSVLPILSDLISAYRNEKIYKFLHLPVQSGDDAILGKMNRGYKANDFEKIVDAFRNNFRCQLWTDVIVGFPGETEKQFQKTFKLIEKTKPDWVNVSRYGPRPGTPASKMKRVESKIVSRRCSELSKLVRELSLKKNREWIDWKGEILIYKRGKERNQWFGRNFAYKPFLVELKGSNHGRLIDVRAVQAKRAFIVAEPV
jgi:threonylcarbamoyladenosine tRNA methylthiotransferase CDKAL1